MLLRNGLMTLLGFEVYHHPHCESRTNVPNRLHVRQAFAAEMERQGCIDQQTIPIFPPRILEKRGLHPGDELTLVEAAEGLLVYQRGVDPLTAQWWNSLNEDERRQAQDEARGYQSLSEVEQDRIWDSGAESIEVDAESDEIELPAK